jgi:hypothetical protein
MTARLNGRGEEKARVDVVYAMLRTGPKHTNANMAGIASLETTVIILSTDWENIWTQIVDIDLI